MENKISLSISRVTPDQVDELKKISIDTFFQSFYHLNTPSDFESYTSSAFARAKLLEEILNTNTHFYFVWNGEDTIGYFKINFNIDPYQQPDPDHMELQRIYVNSNQQSSGIGQEILNFIFKLGQNLKYKKIWLGVWNQNNRAIRFYEKNGFLRIGEHPFLLGEDLQTDDLYQIEI